MAKKISVAFLWHMHQPLYKDLMTGKYHLPWVRLHSTFSYYDMASVLKDFPSIKCTFNITPVLAWQISDIAEAEELDDTYFTLSKKAAGELSPEEKAFVLKNFFSCDHNTAIQPVAGYRELHEKRGSDIDEDVLFKKAELFTEEEIRDLQVHFNLAWCGFTLRSKDPLIRALVNKGRGYTENEKIDLLEKQIETVRSILPLYRELSDNGQIEISTTPFYHPIMPLLCGEKDPVRDLSIDAEAQVEKAVKFHEKIFGRSPRGMWPSEGSVSPEIIPILKKAGIEWMATDEGIVLESFRGAGRSREDLIYRTFTAGDNGENINVIFRDINISNAIGFRYSKLHSKDAVADMISDIRGVCRAMADFPDRRILSIILDGENPWPYYSDGGQNFLRHLYSELSGMKEAETLTISEHIRSCTEKPHIPEIHSGSWIDRNFRKWSGSPQKDRAWEYLEKARKEVFSVDTPSKEVLEELYIAEGSDWFWWYDEFGTELNFVFDELFRMHLSNIYRLLGRSVPHYLEEPMPETPLSRKLPVIARQGEMVRNLNVLYVTSEAVPFAKTGGLADVSRGLPAELVSLGCDIRVVMPYYKCVEEGGYGEVSCGTLKGPYTKKMPEFSFMSHRSSGVTTYFVRKDSYYFRPYLYGSPEKDYRDNYLRFGFFSRSIPALIETTGFRPDIIHCNDWQTALLPFFLKYELSGNPLFTGIRTLFTIHNLAYQGLFTPGVLKHLSIPGSFFNMNDLEFYGKVNFMKSGILYSDAVSTVSHKYAEEIMTPEFGCGLEGLIKSRKDVLYGIPNGADYSVWDPATDDKIVKNYDAGTISGKVECKKDLIERAGLDILTEMPVIGCVSRLVEQKGMDLLAGAAGKIITLGAGIVVLGSGSEKYNRMFSELKKKYPRNISVCFDFNDELAHKIEAGADIFVMPSRYEPCGLNQIYSLKYGTIPVVRATGGLDDVVTDIGEDAEAGNGFKFASSTEEAFFKAVKRAIEAYHDRELWSGLMQKAMRSDLSWARSAESYLALYREITGL